MRLTEQASRPLTPAHWVTVPAVMEVILAPNTLGVAIESAEQVRAALAIERLPPRASAERWGECRMAEGIYAFYFDNVKEAREECMYLYLSRSAPDCIISVPK